MAEPADFIGPAVVAEVDRLLAALTPASTLPRGFVNPAPQAKYLATHLGPAEAARRLGVTARTFQRWIAGGAPSKRNARKLDQAYHLVRDPKARTDRKRRSARAGMKTLVKLLTSPPPTRVQVFGTVQISEDARYRDPFAGTPEISLYWWGKIIDAWQHEGPDEVGEVFVEALNEALPEIANQFWFPEADCNVDILAEY